MTPAVTEGTFRDLQRGARFLNPEMEELLAGAVSKMAGDTRRHKLILALRYDQTRTQAVVHRMLAPVLAGLGERVALAAEDVGGVVVEATPPTDAEVHRISHIVTASQLGQYKTEHMNPVFTKAWALMGLRTAETIIRYYNLPIDPRAISTKMLEAGGRRIGLMDLNASTKQALFELLALAKEEGTGVKKIGRQEISKLVPAGRFVNAGPAYRGELIARTETLTAQRDSSLESYHQSNMVNKVMAYDGESDELCAERNGQVFSLGDAEQEETHPNCVLAWGPVL